ncbi:MAG: class I SAM-dependent methyltransferase [Haloarculaceae archaeon]
MSADPDGLRARIADQFSYRGPHAEVWRGFDRFLATDAYLNLGYSPWYLPHVVGSPQRRLARRIGRLLADCLGRTAGVALLDVGCGRGGPAIEFAQRFGFGVTGIDLVPYNVRQARENARDQPGTLRFAIGTAGALPIADAAVAAVTSMDALVYVPDRSAAVAEFARVLEPGGVVAVSDLVVVADAGVDGRRAVERFAAAWDMPVPASVAQYRDWFGDAGLAVRRVEDVTANSVGRFRKWSTAFLRLADGPARPALARLFARFDLDLETVRTQVRRAHAALPHLRHVIVVASEPDG